MNIFAFNIKTIPDIEAGKKLYKLDGLSDHDVVSVMLHKRRQQYGHEFLPLYLQKIVAISAVWQFGDGVSVSSFGAQAAESYSKEKIIINDFLHLCEKNSSKLVCWDGARFVLPVIRYRMLLHGIESSRLFCDDCEMELDLNHTLAGDSSAEPILLDDIAIALGLPANEFKFINNWDEYENNNLNIIESACEYDALHTYLVYLRSQLVRSHLSVATYELEVEKLKATLKDLDVSHFNQFLNEWGNN